MQLERHLSALAVDDFVHVRLLPDPDLSPHPGHGPTIDERFERQEIVSERRQSIAIVLSVFVVHQLVLEELFDVFKATAALQSGDGVDELHGDDLVILHPHLRRHEDAPRVLIEVSQNVHVELHVARTGGGGRALGVERVLDAMCATRAVVYARSSLSRAFGRVARLGRRALDRV